MRPRNPVQFGIPRSPIVGRTHRTWANAAPALLMVCVAAMVRPAAAGEQSFVWPHGAKAAVSLAYDDALDSQLDTAIPALNKAGLKASFYLTLSSKTVNQRMAEWRAAAAQGHELANHTLFHQCSRAAPDRKWVTAENDLDRISATQLAAQIRVGNTLLHAIDGRRDRTFTAPCGDLKAGGENYLDLIKSDFVAVKAEAGDIVVDMATLDPYAVRVFAPSDKSGAELIALVKRAARAGTMANITFHGIGGDYLSVSRQAHEELLRYLAANRHIYWTDTFMNIMLHVKTKRDVNLAAPTAPK